VAAVVAAMVATAAAVRGRGRAVNFADGR
jgi:hypothetical protein